MEMSKMIQLVVKFIQNAVFGISDLMFISCRNRQFVLFQQQARICAWYFEKRKWGIIFWIWSTKSTKNIQLIAYFNSRFSKFFHIWSSGIDQHWPKKNSGQKSSSNYVFGQLLLGRGWWNKTFIELIAFFSATTDWIISLKYSHFYRLINYFLFFCGNTQAVPRKQNWTIFYQNHSKYQ